MLSVVKLSVVMLSDEASSKLFHLILLMYFSFLFELKHKNCNWKAIEVSKREIPPLFSCLYDYISSSFLGLSVCLSHFLLLSITFFLLSFFSLYLYVYIYLSVHLSISSTLTLYIFPTFSFFILAFITAKVHQTYTFSIWYLNIEFYPTISVPQLKVSQAKK